MHKPFDMSVKSTLIRLGTLLAALAASQPYTDPVKPLIYKNSTIFSYFPLPLQNGEQGFLLGLNSTVALVTQSGQVLSYLSYVPDRQAITRCKATIRETKRECHNLIYTVTPYYGHLTDGQEKGGLEGTESFICCGSFASSTQCKTFFVKNQKQLVWRDEERKLESEIFTEQSHGTHHFIPRMSTTDFLHKTFYNDRTGRLEVLAGSILLNDQSSTMDARLFKFTPERKDVAKLVGRTFNEDKVTEDTQIQFKKIVNYKGKSLIWYTSTLGSKIAQVCQNDEGANFKNYDEPYNRWTTLVQSDLQCQGGTVTYKRLVTVGEPFSIDKSDYILAAFTLDNGMDALIQSSVVCVYSMDNILEGLSAQVYSFQEKFASDDMMSSRRDRVGYTVVPPRYGYLPEECPAEGEKRTKYSQVFKKLFQWQERTWDINYEISSVSPTPILTSTFTNSDIEKYKITTITNGPTTTGSNALPFYVGTSEGHVLRYVLRLKRQSILAPVTTKSATQGLQLLERMVLEDLIDDPTDRCQVASQREVREIDILDKNTLLVKFDKCIVPLPLKNCQRHSDCETACALEPSCTWMETKGCLAVKAPRWKSASPLEFCKKTPIIVPEPTKTLLSDDTAELCSGWTGKCHEEADRLATSTESPVLATAAEKFDRLDEDSLTDGNAGKSGGKLIDGAVEEQEFDSANMQMTLIAVVAGCCIVVGLLLGYIIRPFCSKSHVPPPEKESENANNNNHSLLRMAMEKPATPRSKSSSGRGSSSSDQDPIEVEFGSQPDHSKPLLQYKMSQDKQSTDFGYVSQGSHGSASIEMTKRNADGMVQDGYRRFSESSTPGGAPLPSSNYPSTHCMPGLPNPHSDHTVPWTGGSTSPVLHSRGGGHISMNGTLQRGGGCPGGNHLTHHVAQPSYHSKQDSTVSKSEYRDILAPLGSRGQHAQGLQTRAQSLDSHRSHTVQRIPMSAQQHTANMRIVQQMPQRPGTLQMPSAPFSQGPNSASSQSSSGSGGAALQSQTLPTRGNAGKVGRNRSFNQLYSMGQVQPPVRLRHGYERKSSAPTSAYASQSKLPPVSPEGSTNAIHYTMTLDRQKLREKKQKRLIPVHTPTPPFLSQQSAPSQSFAPYQTLQVGAGSAKATQNGNNNNNFSFQQRLASSHTHANSATTSHSTNSSSSASNSSQYSNDNGVGARLSKQPKSTLAKQEQMYFSLPR